MKLAAVTLPAAATVSPEWGIAMALGMLGGYLARVGIAVEARKPWTDIRRDMVVSALIALSSMIATVTFASFLNVSPLGVAAIGCAVGLAGVDAINLLKKFVFAPIIAAIRTTEKENP